MNIKYNITLSSQQKEQLKKLVKSGKENVRVVRRGRTLLKSNQKIASKQIAKEEGIDQNTVMRIKSRFVEGGLERALYDSPRTGQPVKIDAKAENHLVAIACSDPPEGRVRWTLELLRQKMINDGQVKEISTVSLLGHLQKRGIKPWLKKNVVRAKT